MLNSWDRFEVPLPLSRAVYVYGTPIEVPRRLDDEEIERLRLRLENELKSLTERAEKEFDTLWKSGAR